MKAIVIGLSPEQEDRYDVARGDQIEVVGFVNHSYSTWAIFVGTDGRLNELPYFYLRAETDADRMGAAYDATVTWLKAHGGTSRRPS